MPVSESWAHQDCTPARNAHQGSVHHVLMAFPVHLKPIPADFGRHRSGFSFRAPISQNEIARFSVGSGLLLHPEGAARQTVSGLADASPRNEEFCKKPVNTMSHAVASISRAPRVCRWIILSLRNVCGVCVSRFILRFPFLSLHIASPAIKPNLRYHSDVPKTAIPAAFGAHRGIQNDRPMGQPTCPCGHLPIVSPVFRQA